MESEIVTLPLDEQIAYFYNTHYNLYMYICRPVFSMAELNKEEADQHLRIAIWKALLRYSPERGCPVGVWVKWCVRHYFYDLGRKATTEKFKFRKKFFSTEELVEVKTGHDALARVVVQYDAKVEERLHGEEFVSMLRSILPPFEEAVLDLYLAGEKPKNMADILIKQGFLGVTPKSVDNAITRIKKRKVPRVRKCQEENLPLKFRPCDNRSIKKTPQ